MKKFLTICLFVFICIASILIVLDNAIFDNLYADEKPNYDTNQVVDVAIKMFGEKKIQTIEHLYGFDESPDFVYINFADYGYAVYFGQTMELVEYSPFGELPYNREDITKKYYAGPMNYYGLVQDKVLDLYSNKFVNMSINVPIFTLIMHV